MSNIPDEAVETAAEEYWLQYDPDDDDTLSRMRAALEAALPAIRKQVAEEIAQAIEGVDPVEWVLAGQACVLDAARIAREIGARP